MPRLSVVIPVYNPGAYFKSCLETALVDDEDIEYIIIDDGSTEDLSQVFKKYAQKKNVVIMRTKNQGVSEARNTGIRLACGDYVMFVDADDCLLDGWEETVHNINKDLDFIKFSSKFNGDSIDYNNSIMTSACLGFSGTILDSCGFANVVSGFYKRKFLIDKNITFDNSLRNGEDLIFNLKVLQNTDKVEISSDGFYFYRHNKRSSSHTFGERIIASDRLFRERLASMLGDKFKDEILLSNANGLYVVANNLLYTNNKKIKTLIKEVLKTHNIAAELKIVSNTKNISKFRKIVIKNLLKQNISFPIFLLRAKKVVRTILPTNKGEVV